MLAANTFKTIIENMPVFAMDLVVINEYNELLLGKRLNPPAKDYWFVPGGRVFKNESLVNAFKRVSANELGSQYELSQATLLGVFEHFYDDSVFDSAISTHYINATHFLKVNSDDLNLPINEQHQCYRWLKMSTIEPDTSIHPYSKVFMPSLLKVMAASE